VQVSKHARQYKTTFSRSWERRFLAVLQKYGVKQSEFIRESIKKEITHYEEKGGK
jgi:hypothetical protein